MTLLFVIEYNLDSREQGRIKMKKRELTPHELDQVIQLRKAGYKWIEIDRKTKVERRAAKRAYEEWERDQELILEKKVRLRIVADAFHEHLNSITKIFKAFVIHLDIPKSIYNVNNSEQHLLNLWQTNILEEEKPPLVSQIAKDRDAQLQLQQNLTLFNALKEHTRDKIQWETVLDRWRVAWDSLVNLKGQLWELAQTTVARHKKDLATISILEEKSGNKDVFRCIVDIIFEAVGQDIITSKLCHENALARINPDTDLPNQLIITRLKKKVVLSFVDAETANKVLKIIDSTYNSLSVLVRMRLDNDFEAEINKINIVVNELNEVLNPLFLRPILLHTWCKLCPV